MLCVMDLKLILYSAELKNEAEGGCMLMRLKKKLAMDMMSAFVHLTLAKVPQIAWLFGSIFCIFCSFLLFIFGKKHESLFVGQWAPTMLLLGFYQRLIKISGIY